MVKALILGVDGLDRKWSKHYNLSFLERGEICETYVSRYQATLPSWTSIYTGLQQKEHNMPRAWQRWVRELNRKPSVNDFEECIWFELNRRGYTTGVFGMPLTYPPPIVKGWSVAGFPSPGLETKPYYPLKIGKHLEKEHVDCVNRLAETEIAKNYDSIPSFMVSEENKKLWKREFGAAVRPVTEMRIREAKRILDNNPVDIMFMGFQYVDHGAHYQIPFEKVYEWAEWGIEKIYDTIEADIYCIVSDHGLDPDNTWNHSHEGVFFVDGEKITTNRRFIFEFYIKEVMLRWFE